MQVAVLMHFAEEDAVVVQEVAVLKAEEHALGEAPEEAPDLAHPVPPLAAGGNPDVAASDSQVCLASQYHLSTSYDCRW